MSYEQLRSIVGGANPQSVSYGDIISAIQSQYTPQTQFAPTRSLLDSIGTLVPDQPRIAYGSLLQAQPTKAIKLFGSTTGRNTDAAASVDSGVINSVDTPTNKITGNTAIDNTLIYNNNLTGGTTGDTTGLNIDTTKTGLFGTNVTGTDIANVAGTVAPIAALAGNSDLVKTAIALNLIGSAADIKTEQDVLNLGAKIAMLAAGPAGNALAAGLGLASGNTPMTVNALLGAANPVLGLVNTISGNLTDYTLGDIVNGLLNTSEGTVGQYGLLGAANIAKTDDASRRAAAAAYNNLDANTLRVLADLGDTEAKATLLTMAGGNGSTYNPISDLSTAGNASYWNLFTPVAGTGSILDQTSGKALR
jgi:hypothetical protein